MLILLTIFLFLLIPLVMLILRFAWPKQNVHGFIAVGTVIAGWILVLLTRTDLPHTIIFPQWQPSYLFSISPALLIDNTSWYFALALTTLAFSVVVTSIAQLGQSPISILPPVLQQSSSSMGMDLSKNGDHAEQGAISIPTQPNKGWLLWASILSLTSLGLLAVTAGNILTILLAWTAVDLFGLIILLGQISDSKLRERVILAFSAKMAGLCIALGAGFVLWSNGSNLSFPAISTPVSTLLVLAVGLRLGILPLHLPFSKSLPINRHLGAVLQLIPTATSYLLLVRISILGTTEIVTPYFLGFSLLAGLYASIRWLQAKNEVDGRIYWLLATSSLVVGAAILRQQQASLAWGIASVLSGGFVLSMFLRHKNLLPLLLVGFINLSALPFTPTWQGTAIYQFSSSTGINVTLFSIISIFFLFIQALILAGFIKHSLNSLYPSAESTSIHTERWVWLLYPLGLSIFLITHLLIGWFILPDLHTVSLVSWFIGPVSVLIAGMVLFVARRLALNFQPTLDGGLRPAWDRIFSLDWLYRFLWRVYRSLSSVFSLISGILEGDGGLLWALVLFGLIFVFLQR